MTDAREAAENGLRSPDPEIDKALRDNYIAGFDAGRASRDEDLRVSRAAWLAAEKHVSALRAERDRFAMALRTIHEAAYQAQPMFSSSDLDASRIVRLVEAALKGEGK